MRLLYNHVLKKTSPKDCDLIIDILKGRVAVAPTLPNEKPRSNTSLSDTVFRFFTTSRVIEKWLQDSEELIRKMSRKKIALNLWMILGGYGSGKSHIKEYLLNQSAKYSNIQSLELKIASLLSTELNEISVIDNAYALILIQAREHLDALFAKLSSRPGVRSIFGPTNVVKENLRKHISNDDFIDVFCKYGESISNDRGDFKPLQEILIAQSSEVFLPLMKLYKEHLGINGVCIFIDEFEDVKLLDDERRIRFIESIRALYDTLANARRDPDLPSFNVTILCALSYWDEIKGDTRSQALETRTTRLEIPQLTEDEIISLAEKLYALYKKAGRLKGEIGQISIDFTAIPKYLADIAALKEPLTPRFVISTLMDTVENPGKYLLYMLKDSSDNKS